MVKEERIILGVDPGTSIMGYGIIKVEGKKVSLLVFGVITLSKYDNHAVRLKIIFDRMQGLIDEYHPDELAIESPFFGKNVQSMLKLGKAQGIAIAAALSRDMHYTEYAPRKIKQSITGSGNASKEQVAAMLQTIFKIPKDKIPKNLDATDGLAAALCHFYQSDSVLGSSSYTGWKGFLSQNPKRVKK